MIGNVQIRAKADGSGQVLLDGADLSEAVVAVRLEVSPGSTPRLTLDLVPAELTLYIGPADVHVVEREGVRAWLDGIDPADLDRVLLARSQRVKPGEAVLDHLLSVAGDTAGARDPLHEHPERDLHETLDRALADAPTTTQVQA